MVLCLKVDSFVQSRKMKVAEGWSEELLLFCRVDIINILCVTVNFQSECSSSDKLVFAWKSLVGFVRDEERWNSAH